MNKVNTILAVIALGAGSIALMSFKNTEKEAVAHRYLQITTIESVVPGGFARSRMIATDKNGGVEELKLENFYSMMGINFQNIRFNDAQITSKIESYANEGWEIVSVTSNYTGAPSSQGGASNGIVISRYLLKKAE
jgi:hypothetical protein